jgi:hypothetical protein
MLSDDGIDIDKLIQEGEKKALQLKEEAVKQAEKMQNYFDFSMD